MLELRKSRRHFDILLVAVIVLVALAAIFISLVSIPNDSWILCKVGIHECEVI